MQYSGYIFHKYTKNGAKEYKHLTKSVKLENTAM